jgi:hypothetical protein
MANRIHSTQSDRLTGSPLSISTDHNYIHQGKGFTLCNKTGSITAGSQYVIKFQTPTDKYVHLRPTGWSTTANIGELTIAEGSTTSGGSAGTAYNRNHNSTKTPGVTITVGATMGTEGTIKFYQTAGVDGSGSTRSGGQGSGEDNELVLKQGTIYTFALKNIGSSTATIFYFDLFWYEEDEGLI